MSLLTADELLTLDYAWGGQPACDTTTDTTFPDTGSLDYAFGGQPFVAAGDITFAVTRRPQIFVCT